MTQSASETNLPKEEEEDMRESIRGHYLAMPTARFIQRAIVFTVVVVIALASAPPVAFGAAVTEVLIGQATTSTPGIPFPVQITGQQLLPAGCDPAAGQCTTVRMTYVYRASGEAKGDIKGTFGYEEKGWFDTDLAGNLIGNGFQSGAFTVVRDKDGSTVTATFSSVAIAGGVIGSKKTETAPKHLIEELGLHEGELYATFTFTNACGSYTGYATPDWKKIAIKLTMAC